jgi:hypothetical protein
MRKPLSASFFLILFAGFLAACATRPAFRGGSAVQEEAIPSPPPPSPPVEAIPSPLDELVRRVKTDDPELVKYFVQDEEGTITVKAEAGAYEILYDLSGARLVSPSLWEIDFSVYRAEPEEIRRDSLLWKPPHDDSGILLSLDDNYEDQWRRYFDLFDRYGVKLTFFVIGDFSPFVPRP